MILTKSDINRISSLGYKLEEYAIFDGKFWLLKNVNGKCFFLDENGKCKIYDHRPLGCRAYPVIKIDGKCTPDIEVCPHADLMTEDEIKAGCKILEKIFKELEEGYEV